MNAKNDDYLVKQFEGSREHLRSVAYRMLGSAADAEDAVQEAWIRLSRTEVDEISNLGGWLTTVVSRVCLDMLRSRKARREDLLSDKPIEPLITGDKMDPQEEAALADSVGLAMLVVMQKLTPPERVAFVLHDMFDVPFDDIAPVLGRTTTATRKLASRARDRIRGKSEAPDADRQRRTAVVDAYLAAARRGDFEALMQLLDPDLAVSYNGAAGKSDRKVLAESAIKAGARYARPALVNGNVGIVVAPLGQLRFVIELEITGDVITAANVISKPDLLESVNVTTLNF